MEYIFNIILCLLFSCLIFNSCRKKQDNSFTEDNNLYSNWEQIDISIYHFYVPPESEIVEQIEQQGVLTQKNKNSTAFRVDNLNELEVSFLEFIQELQRKIESDFEVKDKHFSDISTVNDTKKIQLSKYEIESDKVNRYWYIFFISKNENIYRFTYTTDLDSEKLPANFVSTILSFKRYNEYFFSSKEKKGIRKALNEGLGVVIRE